MPWVEGEARDEADRPDRLEDAAVAGVEAIERGRRFVGRLCQQARANALAAHKAQILARKG